MVGGRLDVNFWDPFQKLFVKIRFNIAISQASGNLPEEIGRLDSCVIGVDNNEAPSFRKIPERSSISGFTASNTYLGKFLSSEKYNCSATAIFMFVTKQKLFRKTWSKQFFDKVLKMKKRNGII